MTTIKARCPECGDVDLTPKDVRLLVCSESSRSRYEFACTKCGDIVNKPADDHIISLLISGGIVPEVFVLPAEALEVHTGPPLTYDDLLDFCLKLGNPEVELKTLLEAYRPQ